MLLTPLLAAALSLPIDRFVPPVPTLHDVAGTDYNVDSVSGLYWRDVVATQGLSFAEAATGGWRHANGVELSALFATNLSWMTPITPPGLPTDFAGQTGSSASMLQAGSFMSVLGGATRYDEQRYGSELVAWFDRPTSEGAYSAAGVYRLPDVYPSIATLGGIPAASLVGAGHWLVSPVAPVPEPTTLVTMTFGLMAVLGVRRLRRAPAPSRP
jgi:hypothetical protein